MRLYRIILTVGLIGVVIVLAPFALAVGKGLLAATDRDARNLQAIALLDAYRAYDPPALEMPHIDWGLHIRACGYREEQLFPGGRDLPRDDQWSPYGGYFDLTIWSHKQIDISADIRRLVLLESETTTFSSEFLRICMRQSLFAPLCARRVRHILEHAGWEEGNSVVPGPRIDQSRQARTICAYLDGIAARRGQPVAERGAP